jgi:hypothetical protein
MKITHLETCETLLTCPVADRAALLGLLNRIRATDLKLVSMEKRKVT